MKAFRDMTKIQIFQTVEGPGVVKAHEMTNAAVPVMKLEDFDNKTQEKPARRKRRSRKSTPQDMQE